MPEWMHWIGLPHRFGARPQDGVGADCVLMVWSILDAAGIYHPPFDPTWFELAEKNEWTKLQMIWNSATKLLDEPVEYAVTLFNNGPSGLGVAIVIDGGLLMVHHRRGVYWMPLVAMRRLPYYEFT